MRKSILGVTPVPMNKLVSHSWPGNVRELQHAIEKAVILSAGQELIAR